MNLIRQLTEIDKLFYTISDIEKILHSNEFSKKGSYSRASIYVILNRLIIKGELIRIFSGIYILPDKFIDIERIANILYFPSYLSFESALSRYGLVSQIPYSIIFASMRKTKNIRVGNYNLKYRQIKKPLFFGYEKLENGLYVALPEKSILDMLYIISFGKVYFPLDSVDKTKLKPLKLLKLSERYPAHIQLEVRKFIE